MPRPCRQLICHNRMRRVQRAFLRPRCNKTIPSLCFDKYLIIQPLFLKWRTWCQRWTNYKSHFLNAKREQGAPLKNTLKIQLFQEGGWQSLLAINNIFSRRYSNKTKKVMQLTTPQWSSDIWITIPTPRRTTHQLIAFTRMWHCY